MKPYYEEPGIRLYHGDCREILPELAGESFDLILTDPPYGIEDGAAFVRQNCEVVERWDGEGHNRLVADWRSSAASLLAASGYFVEFHNGDYDATEAVRQAHSREGLVPWRRFALVKAAPPPTPRPTLASGFELAMISYLPPRVWHGGGYHLDRWIGLTPNRLGRAEHPTEKPLAAIEQLMGALSAGGARVLDPFVGSGTALVAAKRFRREAVGIELNERWCELAVERLRRTSLPLPVPPVTQPEPTAFTFEP
jgi:site-specific DNA-methyltransferase (adenine-specific)